MESSSAVERRDERAHQQLEKLIEKIEKETFRATQELRMTAPVRAVAERAFRKVARARRYGVLPRHSEVQQRFLRCMILQALGIDPALQKRAREVARYYSKNYVCECLSNAVTLPAREIARDMILRAADSEWGDTPLAGQLAYVIVHHQELEVNHLSDYSELYTRALTLDRGGFFYDRAGLWRVRLGLAGLEDRRQEALHRVNRK